MANTEEVGNFGKHRRSNGRTALVVFSTVLGLAAFLPAAQSQTLTVLHSFSCHADGTYPEGPLIRDAAGNLYGTTYEGGDTKCSLGAGCGKVFKLASNGKLTALHEFTGGADGAFPLAGVIQDASGNLYGTTSSNVFKLDPSGGLTVLHTFRGSADGSGLIGGLTRDAQGNLYGTTEQGGNFGSLACSSSGCGTVYKLDSTGAETILHRFAGGADGLFPWSGVIRDAAGNLYGTTVSGGAFAAGTVFKLDAAGNKTVLYSFAGGFSDGAHPFSGLTMDAEGNFYGTTELGGAYLLGTVFKLDTAGNETVLYSFRGADDGGGPFASLVLDPAGNLYGATPFGGTLDFGTVFELDSTGKHTVLHRFLYYPDGNSPQGILRDAAGNLYGAALGGGPSGCGTVFEIKP